MARYLQSCFVYATRLVEIVYTIVQGSRRSGPADLVTVRAAERLRQATLPRYHSLFTQISRLDNGVKFLASLRSDVIVSSPARIDFRGGVSRSEKKELKKMGPPATQPFTVFRPF